MSQADMEKAYTEAVEHLARAVEANELLTERLQAYEIRESKTRADCMSSSEGGNRPAEREAYCPDGCGGYGLGFNDGMAEQACDTLEILDRLVGPSHDDKA